MLTIVSNDPLYVGKCPKSEPSVHKQNMQKIQFLRFTTSSSEAVAFLKPTVELQIKCYKNILKSWTMSCLLIHSYLCSMIKSDWHIIQGNGNRVPLRADLDIESVQPIYQIYEKLRKLVVWLCVRFDSRPIDMSSSLHLSVWLILY